MILTHLKISIDLVNKIINLELCGIVPRKHLPLKMDGKSVSCWQKIYKKCRSFNSFNPCVSHTLVINCRMKGWLWMIKWKKCGNIPLCTVLSYQTFGCLVYRRKLWSTSFVRIATSHRVENRIRTFWIWNKAKDLGNSWCTAPVVKAPTS